MSDARSTSGDRATIDDVAQQAGVSVATVSRALRGLPNVAATTRARIERVAADLHYRPDPAAARLAAGRTRTITIGIPALNGWYFSNVVAGAEAVSTEAGFEVQVIGIGSHADLERLVDPSAGLERRTDALVLVDIDLEPEVAATLRSRGVMVGTVGFHVDGCPGVQIDDHEVGRLAGAHLLEIGCERPAIVGGLPDQPMRLRVPELRRAGFEAALHAVGRTLDGRIAHAVFDLGGGRTAMAELLDRPGAPPDGVLAMSDEMAFGALMELRARRIPVGVGRGAVALVGVDDHEFSQVVELTTVHQQVDEHGAGLTRRLIDAMDAERLQTSPDRAVSACTGADLLRPPVRLVRRASTNLVESARTS